MFLRPSKTAELGRSGTADRRAFVARYWGRSSRATVDATRDRSWAAYKRSAFVRKPPECRLASHRRNKASSVLLIALSDVGRATVESLLVALRRV